VFSYYVCLSRRKEDESEGTENPNDEFVGIEQLTKPKLLCVLYIVSDCGEFSFVSSVAELSKFTHRRIIIVGFNCAVRYGINQNEEKPSPNVDIN